MGKYEEPKSKVTASEQALRSKPQVIDIKQNINLLLVVGAALLLIGTQLLFLRILNSHSEMVVQSLKGHFQHELKVNDAYLLAQSIENLESLGLFRCAVLSIGNKGNSIQLDTQFRGNCEANQLLLDGTRSELLLNAINGATYGLKLTIPSPPLFTFLIWFSRAAIVFVFAAIGVAFHGVRRKDLQVQEIYKRAAHDIRAPILCLKAVEGQLDFSATPDTRLLFQESIKRMEALAQDFLKQRQSRQNTSSDNWTEIAPLIERRLEDFKLMTNDRKIQFSFQKHIKGNPKVQGSDKLWNRLLHNLISNAVEAIPTASSGRINVALLNSRSIYGAKRVQISIRDNGIGISWPNRLRVGRKGFTLGKENGNGIGVASAIDAVKSIGGRIRYFSRLKRGTEVRIQL